MENKKGKTKERIALILLLVVLCSGVATGVVLFNQKNNDKVSSEEADTKKPVNKTETSKVSSNQYTVIVKSDTGVVLPNVLVSIYDAEGNAITDPEATDAVGRLIYTPEEKGTFGACVMAAPHQYALDRQIYYFEEGKDILNIILKEDPSAYVAKIGDINYTLKGAIAAANAATEDVTITLLHDVYVVSETYLNNKSGKTITIDGAGHTLTYLANSTFFSITQKAGTVHFKNMTISHNGAGAVFRTSNAINLNMTDVTILAQNDTEGFYKWSLINLCGEGKTNLTMTRVKIDMDITTIEKDATAASVIRTGNEGIVKDIKIVMNDCDIDATGAIGRAGIRVTPDTTANIVFNNTKFLTQNNYVVAVDGQLTWSQTNSTLSSLDEYYDAHPIPDAIATVAGVKYYSLNAAAKKASQLGGKEVVKLIGDVTVGTSTTFTGNGITAVIDGNGHTLTTERGNTIFKIGANNYKLTFRNMTINHGGYERLLQYEAKKEGIDVTFENVTVVASGTTEDACYKYGLINLRGSGSFTMNSSSITLDVPKIINGSAPGVIRTGNANDGQKLTISLDNSKIDVSKTNGAYGIYVQKSAATDIVLKNYEIHTNNRYPVYVHADDGDATLTYDNMSTWSSKSATVNWLCNLLSLLDIEDAAKIGDTAYRTLSEAFKAAQAAGGKVTITLLRDCILSARTDFKTANSNITIDGAGKYSLTTTGSALLFVLDNDNVALTFKNLKIDHKGYDRFITFNKKSEGVYEGVNVVFDNVTMNASGTSADKCYPYGVFNLRASGALAMIDSTITLDVAKVAGGNGYSVIRLGNAKDGQNVEITMKNSTIDASKTENIAGIYVQEGAIAEVETSNSTIKTNNKYAINVNSKGKLTLAQTATTWSSVDTTIKSITNCKTMVDNACYMTFTEAWNVAKESGKATTITLLNDCNVTKVLTKITKEGTKITIDGDDKYSFIATPNGQMFILEADNVALTFKDLVIDHKGNDRFVTSGKKNEGVYTGVNVTLDNVQMKASGTTEENCYQYGLFNLRATGELTLTNSKITLDVDEVKGVMSNGKINDLTTCGVIRLGNAGDGQSVKITLENSTVDASKTKNIAGINVSNGTTAEVRILNSTIKINNKKEINVNSTGALKLAQSNPEWTYENITTLTNCEAKIGDVYYGGLAGACDMAESGNTVYVVRDIQLGKTLTIGNKEAPKELTITNIAGKNVTITRTKELTANMFEIKVGSKLKLGTAGSTQILTIDGMNVEAASLIKNAGEFVANDNVTIQNANAGTATGGVLYNTGKEATATLNGTVTGNGAKQGAVAYNDKGTVTIKKGTYTQNIATQNGGVIYSANGAIVNIEGGLFDSNEAKTATGGVAGGNATTTITGGIFQNNKAANGASVLNIASGYTADISNATITGNTLVREGTKTVYNGAIYISGSGQLTLEDCDIHDNTGLFSSVENPGCDVRLGASAVLNIKNNTSVGVVNKSEKTDGTTGGTINILGENIGTLILIPSKGNYTSSSQLVTFAETLNADKENIAAGIVVREYISQTECTDDKYCVDTEGKLQYKNPEAQIGTTTYLTLADAIAVAETKSIVYVLKDITVDETIAIGSDESPKELTITNIAGKDITITRTTELTANMFEIKVGSKLKLGTAGSTQTLTIDGADVEGKSLIGNAGTFVTNDNVTLQNANAGSTDAVDCYGGVLSNSGTATLDGTMTGNTASRGAVVYNTGTVTIKGGIYSNNTATMGGTVVYSHNKTTAIVNIEDGLFEGNVAQGATGGVASGNNKETTITGGTFCKNTALDGGAVMNVANGCTAIVSNATMTENTVKSGKNNYNGAIYISGGGNLTLKDCNVSGNFGVASSRANPACDVRVGDNATLNIKNNINLGVVSKISAKGTINIIEKYTGQMILFPHSAKYETGIVLVTFAEEMSGDEKANAVANIIVRKYTSNTAYTEDEYCVDTDGLLQYKNAEAKAGIKTYLTLADAIAAADTPSTVYVLKDIEVAGTIAIGSVEEPKELTITNIANKEVTITRTAAVNMFNVPAGSALNIDGTITLDGNKGTVTGASLITNAGTFVTSKDVTIQNASAGTETDKIGGVLTNTGTATLNGTMTGNEAYRGAIVYNTGKVTFESGTYSNNTAKQNAGVIYSNSSSAVVEIQGGLFEYNRSNTGTGGVAAGTATTTITGGTFQNNEAVTGAPVINVATDCTASISNATIKDNKVLEKSGKTDKYYNGAIYLSISATLNLSNCNISGTIGVYKSEKDPGSDIGLGAKSTLNVYDNISVGVVWRRDNKDGEGTINILTENPGTMMLIPFGGTYKEGNSLVTFSNTLSPDAKAKIASAIIVRQYTSKDVWDDTSYYVDTDGKLQKKPAAH